MCEVFHYTRIKMGRMSQERMTGLTYDERVKRAKGAYGFTSVADRFKNLKKSIMYEMAVCFGRIKR